MMYVQCELRKQGYVYVSWIEEKFAKIGTKVRVKPDGLDWEEGWVVTETYGKITEEQVKKMKDLYKQHRKGTDI